MLHDRQKNRHSEDMVLDMAHVGGSDVVECVHDTHLVVVEEEDDDDTVAEVHIPTTPSHGDHMDNAEVGELVEEDGSLVAVDDSPAHELRSVERREDDGRHFDLEYSVQPPYSSPCHSTQPQRFHLVHRIHLLAYHWLHHP
jgi:hypothetical protein